MHNINIIAKIKGTSKEEYAKLNPVEKEDALLKAAVIEKEEINHILVKKRNAQP